MVPWRKISLRPSATTEWDRLVRRRRSIPATWRGFLMIAVQALEKRTAELKQKEAQIAVLESEVKDLEAKQAYFETVAARLKALELRMNPSIRIAAEKSFSDK